MPRQQGWQGEPRGGVVCGGGGTDERGVSLTRVAGLQTLEAEPGDMLRDPENVKANAEATVARYHERLQAEQQARDQVDRVLCA